MNNEDNAAIKTATEALQQTIQKVGASMYQQPPTPPEDAPPEGEAGPAADAGAGPAEGEQPPADDAGDVVDGEFKSV
jgi:molecular chaperone DnaK